MEHIIHWPYKDAALCWYTGLEGLRELMLRQRSAPGLALAISDRLLHWRNRDWLHRIQRLSWSIQAEIYSQDLLDCNNLCFGLAGKYIIAIQWSFLEDSGYKSWGKLCMSKVVRNILDIKKKWEHRNSYVHASNGTIHQHKEEAITAELWREFVLGQNGLPVAYSGFS